MCSCFSSKLTLFLLNDFLTLVVVCVPGVLSSGFFFFFSPLSIFFKSSSSDSFIHTMMKLVSWLAAGGRTAWWPLWLMLHGSTGMRMMKTTTLAGRGKTIVCRKISLNQAEDLSACKELLEADSFISNLQWKQVGDPTRTHVSSPAASPSQKSPKPPELSTQYASWSFGFTGVSCCQQRSHSEDQCAGDWACKTQGSNCTNCSGSRKECTARYCLTILLQIFLKLYLNFLQHTKWLYSLLFFSSYLTVIMEMSL